MYAWFRVQDHLLDPSWHDRFRELTPEPQEDGTTLLSESLSVQRSPIEVLLQIMRLGLVLLSLEISEESGGEEAREYS